MRTNKLVLVILSVFLSAAACNMNRASSGKQNMSRVKISFHYPQKITDTYSDIMITDFFISYYKNYILYELPYHVTQEVDNVLIYDSVKYEFLVKKKDSDFGYKLKSLSDPLDSIMKIDSPWIKRLPPAMDLHDLFKVLKVKSERVLNRQLDAYYFEDNWYDSAYFYYGKPMPGVEYSLSPELERSHRMKLYKTLLFSRKDTSAGTQNLTNFHITSWEIQQVPIPDERALLNVFNRVPQ